MSTQHTPGPWYALAEGITGAEIGYRAIIDDDGVTVCNPSPMGAANARLIAAAPDLLAALQAIVTGNVYGNPTQWNLCIDRGIAAIAKATGGAA
jgi:hypothetical protein